MTRLGPVILIVEDEFLLRLDSAETIESAGFGVIQAANPGEAIAFLRARPDIHVVFTDIQMPGSMDGLKTGTVRSGAAGSGSRSWRPRARSSSATTICRMAACRSRIAAPRWSRHCAR